MTTNLASHPLSVSDDEEEDQRQIKHKKSVDEDSEHFRDKNGEVQIKVTQAPGYLCHIKASAVFRVPPEVLFRQIVCHPDNEKVFRHMDRCSYRKILEDDGHGKQKVEVAHEASWRFLLFHGTFTTRLIVDQDLGRRLMRFTLKPESGGILSRFRGNWQIEPHPEDPGSCITNLDQDLQLRIHLPPPFDRILKGISCNQVRKIFEDVRAEVQKINSGKPTLAPWEQVQLTEIGTEMGGPGGGVPAGAAAGERDVAESS